VLRRVDSVSDSASDWASAPTLGEGSRVRVRRKWKGDMLRERKADVASSSLVREVDDDRARWLSAPLAFECGRPRPSSAWLRVREREERPPIIELRDIRPNEPDVRDGATSGAPLVEEAVDDMRSSAFESACCFVSTLGEDHLEKRGVVGREEAGEEFSDMELVREVGTMGACWEADVEEGRLATEEERE
jgi:hypothetical protein